MPGSHGSLTKAGKVRSQTHGRREFVVVKKGTQTKKVKEGHQRKDIPRLRNKRNYVRRILQRQSLGQQERRERWKR